MPLESNVTGIQDLNPAWPTGVDPISEGDNHVRNVKSAVQQSFPGMSAAWTTDQKINFVGADAGGGAINNVGEPQADADAARKLDVDVQKARIDALPKDYSCGAFLGDGTLLINNTGDFTVTRQSQGQYLINFDNPSLGNFAHVIMAQPLFLTGAGANNEITNVEHINNTQVRIHVLDPGNGNYRDSSISFLRIMVV